MRQNGRQDSTTTLKEPALNATPTNPWDEAHAAAEDLRAALAEIGITLPALGVDMAGSLAGYPLVSLGSAPAADVLAIAARLRSVA